MSLLGLLLMGDRLTAAQAVPSGMAWSLAQVHPLPEASPKVIRSVLCLLPRQVPDGRQLRHSLLHHGKFYAALTLFLSSYYHSYCSERVPSKGRCVIRLRKNIRCFPCLDVFAENIPNSTGTCMKYSFQQNGPNGSCRTGSNLLLIQL